MFLVNTDTSLNIMDSIMNDEKINHTEAKKLMTRKIKTSHRNFLLDTLKHTEKEFEFSSLVVNFEIMDQKITKRVVGKFYKKSDVLLAIEEYKANNTLRNQLEELSKQAEIEEMQQKQIKLTQKENDLKFFIDSRAKEIMEQNNNKEVNDFDPFELLMSEETITYEEAYQQAKLEILG